VKTLLVRALHRYGCYHHSLPEIGHTTRSFIFTERSVPGRRTTRVCRGCGKRWREKE